MTPRSVQALAVVALICGLPGCHSAVKQVNSPLRVDVVAQGDTELMRRILVEATQVGLIGFDGRGAIVPRLASSWRIIDGGKAILFRLRPVADPKPHVVASDIVRAFRRLEQPLQRTSRWTPASLVSG